MNWLEKLGKKNIIKLGSLLLIFIMLLIGTIFAIVSSSIEGDNEIEGVSIKTELKPSSERTESEEKAAVEQIIADVNTNSENLDIEPFTIEEDEKDGELSEESYNKYLEQMRSFARKAEWSEMSNLAKIIDSEYKLNQEQMEMFYPFLMMDSFSSGTFENIYGAWDALSDVESKIYTFANLTTQQQGGIIKSQKIPVLPRPLDGMEIIDIVDENVGWHESNAWKYFSDEDATHIYKITIKFNDNNIYDVYYVENDILGRFITNIANQNKQVETTSYEDYFKIMGIESEYFEFDGGW